MISRVVFSALLFSTVLVGAFDMSLQQTNLSVKNFLGTKVALRSCAHYPIISQIGMTTSTYRLPQFRKGIYPRCSQFRNAFPSSSYHSNCRTQKQSKNMGVTVTATRAPDEVQSAETEKLNSELYFLDEIIDDDTESTALSDEDGRNSDLQRLMNAIILTAAVVFAVHVIVGADEGLTRGWTQKEIMMRLPYDNWRNYEDALASSPVATKTTINIIIYLLGDWLSQTIFAKKNILDFDTQRTLKNGLIGACFGPAVHAYYEFSDYILPVVGINKLYKILMDQTLYLGVKCSVYIAAVGLLNGDKWLDVKERVSERIGPIMFTAWKFWPFVHCITYSVIPAQHRILWVNCVDLLWNAILAGLTSQTEKDDNVIVEEVESIK